MKLKLIDGYLKAYDYSIIEYTDDYFTKLENKYETDKNREMNHAINKVRSDLIDAYCSVHSVLDYGCGTGNFIKYHENNGHCFVYGYDVIPKTVKWLIKNNLYINPYKEIPTYIDGICMWDVFEHIENHSKLLKAIKKGTYLFVSIPIFENLDDVKNSNHYIPNEHLYYFTENSFVDYLASYNFDTLTVNSSESELGRNGIKTFVLKKI